MARYKRSCAECDRPVNLIKAPKDTQFRWYCTNVDCRYYESPMPSTKVAETVLPYSSAVAINAPSSSSPPKAIEVKVP